VAKDGPVALEDRADDSQDAEDLSLAEWKTIATHGREAGGIAEAIASSLGLRDDVSNLLVLAAEVHDVGKSIRYFQGSMRRADRPPRADLAKAPKGAWNRKYLYQEDNGDNGETRRGLRHELASALALFDVLRRCAPSHPALLGEYAELLGVNLAQVETSAATGEWERRIVELEDRNSFDLLAYLVASHHGKVRLSLHAAPVDQGYEARPGVGRDLPIRGIRENDELPAIHGPSQSLMLSPSRLTLEPASLGLSTVTGPSWTERTLGLLERHGPGLLALLEAIVRAADIRASRLKTPDPLLNKEVAQ
jgi:CRISPR-associated endonuclease/helicase Cas3